MSILKVPGTQLFYDVHGSGPLLVLIRGMTASKGLKKNE